MKKSIYLFLGIVLIAALSSCSGNDDDDENFDMPSEKTIYVGDSIKLSKAAKSYDNFVALVHDNGYIVGFHVGQTTIQYKGKMMTLNVRGRYNLYDVITEWGINSNELLQKQKVGKKIIDTKSNGVHLIGYEKVGVANMLGYAFDENDKLIYVQAMSNPTYEKSILNFLFERYMFYPEEVASYTWAGINSLEYDKATTLSLVSLDSKYKIDYMFVTQYISIEYAKSRSISENKYSTLLHTFDFVLK